MNRARPLEAKKTDLSDRIGQCLLFTDLTDRQIDTVLQRVRVADLQEGECLFEQGQHAHEFFLLDNGQIKLARYSPEGHEKIIDLVSQGGTFAEAVMFSKLHVYPVTATATVDSKVFCFDMESYAGILRQSTEACFAILAQMSKRLHFQIAEIDRLTLHGATFRLVCYLLDQVPSTQLGVPEVRLDTRKHIIASRLSITPETLSRSFSKLSREGLIEVHDNAITLTDVGKLRRYAHGEPL
jgi:CRP-like cAMP-binding protein